MRSFSAVGWLVVVAVVVSAQAPPMRPGRWETSMQMSAPGLPEMPPIKSARCVTAEELKKNQQAMLPSTAKPGQPDPCKVSDYSVKGQTVSWKVTCVDPQPMSGTGEMTFKDDTFEGLMKMSHPQMGEMTMKMTGKRLGDCK